MTSLLRRVPVGMVHGLVYPEYSGFSTRRVDTLRPRQNGHYFTDDVFKSIFVNENSWIPNTISLEFIPRCRINNMPALVRIMAWRHIQLWFRASDRDFRQFECDVRGLCEVIAGKKTLWMIYNRSWAPVRNGVHHREFVFCRNHSLSLVTSQWNEYPVEYKLTRVNSVARAPMIDSLYIWTNDG